MMQISSCG